METIHKIFENWHVGPPWAHLFVFALDATVIAAIVFCVREIRRARSAAKAAERANDRSTPLFDGARFVAGTVELAQGERLAIRVTVIQDGTEHSTKNGKYHVWKERDRTTKARPFYLRHESGARIRVEPPEDVLLVDALDQKEWLDRHERRLRAELLPGEHAIVEGILRREHDPEEGGAHVGYRQAASQGWVLKPGRHGRMHVSTEDLSRRHVLRARAFKFALAWMVFAALIAQAPLAPYRARVFLGKNVIADYSGKSSYQTRTSKGGVQTHYIAKVWYGAAGGEREYLDAEIDVGDYRDLPSSPGKMWVRHVPEWETATALGAGSSVHFWGWFLAVCCTFGGIAKLVMTHRYRRWYEGNVEQKGQGELPIPTGERFRADVEKAKKKKRGPVVEIIEP